MTIWSCIFQRNYEKYGPEFHYHDVSEKSRKEISVMEKKLKIIVDNCPQDHKCPAVNVCPVGALSQKDFEAPEIDDDKCIRCGKCSNFCPKKALVL